jgi:S-adenosylmethionine synthetase
MKHIC